VRFANASTLRVCAPPGADLGPLACALAALPPRGWASVRTVTGVARQCFDARLLAPLARLCPHLAIVDVRCSGGCGGGADAVEALAEGCRFLQCLTLHLGPEEANGALAASAGGGNGGGAQAGGAGQQGVDALAAALRRLRSLRHFAFVCEGGGAGCAAARSALLPAVLPALPGLISLAARDQGGSGPAPTLVVGACGPGLRELELHARDAPVARVAATLEGVLPGVTRLTLSQETR
jgi:hypothetical protein